MTEKSLGTESYENRLGIDTASIEAILDRLKGTPLGEDYPEPAQGPEARRKRNSNGRVRKIDRRTKLKKRRARYANLEESERADLARYENGSLKGQFHKLRREMRRRDVEWTLTLAEWTLMWLEAPLVPVGFNNLVPAWKHRGKRKDEVQLKRIDQSVGYNLDNLSIVFNDRVIWSRNQTQVS